MADVSHFVQPGSGLDREAYARGNSVYLPGKMIPMLPKVLCQDLLSLRPHEDRRTISVLLEYPPPPNAVLRGRAFELTLIRSAGRLTYEQVEGFLKGAKPLPSPTLEPDLNRPGRLGRGPRGTTDGPHGAVRTSMYAELDGSWSTQRSRAARRTIQSGRTHPTA
ncbi:MAG: RNB domain-containing ribonuclease [Verrucomicrobiota bacterium]